MANDAVNRELTQQEQDVIRRYLLDELLEPEKEQVEQKLLADASYFEHLLIAEDELIDAYIKGQLAGEERKKFSRHFLKVPELRQDVKFARALHQRAAEHEQRASSRAAFKFPDRNKSLFVRFFQTPAVGFAMAAALIAAISVAVWLGAQNRQLRSAVEQLQAQSSPAPPTQDLASQLRNAQERENSLNAQLRQAEAERTQAEQKLKDTLERMPQQSAERNVNSTLVPAVLLALGGDRESGEQTRIPKPSTTRINLQIELPAKEHLSYSAELKTVDGRRLLTKNNLPFTMTPTGLRISFIVNTKLLPPDDYQVVLSGKDSNGSKVLGAYPFRISR